MFVAQPIQGSYLQRMKGTYIQGANYKMPVQQQLLGNNNIQDSSNDSQYTQLNIDKSMPMTDHVIENYANKFDSDQNSIDKKGDTIGMTNEEYKDDNNNFITTTMEPSDNSYYSISDRWMQLSQAVNDVVNKVNLHSIIEKFKGQTASKPATSTTNLSNKDDTSNTENAIMADISKEVLPEEDVKLLRTAAAAPTDGSADNAPNAPGDAIAPAANPIISAKILGDLYNKYCPPDVQAFIRKPSAWTLIRHPGLLLKLWKLYLLVNRPYKSLLWKAISIARGKRTTTTSATATAPAPV
jgi:hypothetical protein